MEETNLKNLNFYLTITQGWKIFLLSGTIENIEENLCKKIEKM